MGKYRVEHKQSAQDAQATGSISFPLEDSFIGYAYWRFFSDQTGRYVSVGL
nr:hypothetical protein Iba_chr02dCG0930 [Ipomoea batatas]